MARNDAEMTAARVYATADDAGSEGKVMSPRANHRTWKKCPVTRPPSCAHGPLITAHERVSTVHEPVITVHERVIAVHGPVIATNGRKSGCGRLMRPTQGTGSSPAAFNTAAFLSFLTNASSALATAASGAFFTRPAEKTGTF